MDDLGLHSEALTTSREAELASPCQAADLASPCTATELASPSQVAELASVCQTPARQLVWGLYIDELVQQRTYAMVSDALVTTVHYPLQDQLYRTAALTDSGGCIAEAYDYDAYGNTMIYKTPGTGSSWWASDAVATKMVKCEHLFTGRQYDPESEIYHYRARYYLPKLGRFGQRDPIGYAVALNLLSYVENSPTRFLDPKGLFKLGVHKEIVESALSKVTCLGDCPAACKDALLDGLKAGVVHVDVPGLNIYRFLQTHIGDLQFQHAMGSGGETAEVFVNKMIKWIIDDNARKAAAELEKLSQHFLTNRRMPTNDRAETYLRCTIAGNLLGRALHTIADSFAPGHVVRDNNWNVKTFMNYKEQGGDAHSKHDKDNKSREFHKAVEMSAKFLDAVLCGDTGSEHLFENLKNFLKNEVFALHKDASVGGITDEFRPVPIPDPIFRPWGR